MLLQLNNLCLAVDSANNLFIDNYESFFPQILNERIEKKRSAAAKRLSVAAYMLLLNILNEYYGITLVNLKFTENGKPYIENGPFFSVSHSGEYVSVAVSRCPVGVDIEQIRDFDKRIIDKYFSKSEKRYILKKNSDNRFFKLWTIKEAIIKRENKTLSQICDIKTKRFFGKHFYKNNKLYTKSYKNCIISVCFSEKTGK